MNSEATHNPYAAPAAEPAAAVRPQLPAIVRIAAACWALCGAVHLLSACILVIAVVGDGQVSILLLFMLILFLLAGMAFLRAGVRTWRGISPDLRPVAGSALITGLGMILVHLLITGLFSRPDMTLAAGPAILSALAVISALLALRCRIRSRYLAWRQWAGEGSGPESPAHD